MLPPFLVNMKAEQLYEQIQELKDLLPEIGRREAGAIKKLSHLYYQAFKITFAAGCKSCPRKAYYKLQELTLNKIKAMQNQQFKLKKGALINYPAFSPNHYSADNLTDEMAIEILTANPVLIKFFDKFPANQDGTVNLTGQAEVIAPATKQETQQEDYDKLITERQNAITALQTNLAALPPADQAGAAGAAISKEIETYQGDIITLTKLKTEAQAK